MSVLNWRVSRRFGTGARPDSWTFCFQFCLVGYGTNAAGNYYNWYAATAGTGRADVSSSSGNYCDVEVEADGVTPKKEDDGVTLKCRRDANNNPIMAVENGVAKDSICPRGWKLAGYDGKGSYKYLMDTYNMTDNDAGIQSAPLSFLRGGFYIYANGGRLGNVGTYGYFFESTAQSNVAAYIFDFSVTRLASQRNDSKGNGFSIRCVVKA